MQVVQSFRGRGMSVNDYTIVERQREELANFKLIKKTVYEVRKYRIPGLGGMGSRLLATFNDEEEAKRFIEEQVYLSETNATVTSREERKYKPRSYTAEWLQPCGVGEITSKWEERR